ncbi:unnamed protein product [Brachionus calyciflorus]|uniref:Uncharacterized protein n=1 Tax=Brachionus calyciflorus TaxID=104777 RepID=A0A814P6L7_9BILA|nr:unnamed protein product [Brachionus calyciflorus]
MFEIDEIYDPNLILTIKNFKNFESIDYSCLNSYLNKSIYEIYFIPSTQIVLSKNIKSLSYFVRSRLFIFLTNINGIDIEMSSLKNQLNISQTIIEFSFSNFYLYYKNSEFKNCSNDFSTRNNLFDFFKDTNALSFTYTVKYRENLCPLMFRNSLIQTLTFHGLSNSFLWRNILTFKDLNQTLNSNIKQLSISMFNFCLTKSLINGNIFEKVQTIFIGGYLKRIDEFIFKNFKYLKLIQLQLTKNRLFYDGFSKWLGNIGLDNQLVNIEIFFNSEEYFYHEDFCLFQNFPQNKHINLDFYNINSNCSCTVLWLFSKTINLGLNKTCSNFYENECDFKKLENLCNKKTSISLVKTDSLEQLYASEFVNFVSIVLTYFFTFSGLASNFLSRPNKTDRLHIETWNAHESLKHNLPTITTSLDNHV